MSMTVEAVYENGVFRPLQAVELAEGGEDGGDVAEVPVAGTENKDAFGRDPLIVVDQPRGPVRARLAASRAASIAISASNARIARR